MCWIKPPSDRKTTKPSWMSVTLRIFFSLITSPVHTGIWDLCRIPRCYCMNPAVSSWWHNWRIPWPCPFASFLSFLVGIPFRTVGCSWSHLRPRNSIISKIFGDKGEWNKWSFTSWNQMVFLYSSSYPSSMLHRFRPATREVQWPLCSRFCRTDMAKHVFQMPHRESRTNWTVRSISCLCILDLPKWCVWKPEDSPWKTAVT